MSTTILATLNAAGEPVALQAGAPVTTWWVIVADEQEAAWSFTPIGQPAPFEINHPPGQVDTYGPEDRARFCIQVVELVEAPEGERLAGYSLALEGGVITAQATFEPIPPAPVPPTVSRMQAKLVLLEDDELDAVEATIATAPRAVQIYWAEVSELHRDHAVLADVIVALGWSEAYVDDLFRRAAAIR